MRLSLKLRILEPAHMGTKWRGLRIVLTNTTWSVHIMRLNITFIERTKIYWVREPPEVDLVLVRLGYTK